MTKKKKTDFYLLRQKSISEGDLFVTDYIKTKQRLDKLTDELEILIRSRLREDELFVAECKKCFTFATNSFNDLKDYIDSNLDI